jgi:hypothetical protein
MENPQSPGAKSEQHLRRRMRTFELQQNNQLNTMHHMNRTATFILRVLFA